MKKGEKKNGFTMIEVALVLGIAGLIFLMVFIALPALQRNAADAQRRDDIATLIGAIKKYQTNNRGMLPTDWSYKEGGGLYGYLSSELSDPDGAEYTLAAEECSAESAGKACTNNSVKNIEDAEFPESDHTIHVLTSATCDGSTPVLSANKRKVALVYKMQGYGAYCNNT
ncbi:type II secretion system protein [Candidatus Saccharibacteria bacterium]|nr:type II secretion system protein [Candidatus Saccharibacteria bacterium]